MRTPAAAAVALALLAAPAARAQPVSEPSGPSTYLVLQLGAFVPVASDLDTLDPGVALSTTFGAMFTRNVGAEATVGYYRASGTTTQAVLSSMVTTDTALNVVPILASVRLVAPFKALELSARAGAGLHLASRYVTSSWAQGPHAYQTATAFGWQAGAAVAFNLSPNMLVGLDALGTFASAKFGGVETSLDGLQLSVTLGYKL